MTEVQDRHREAAKVLFIQLYEHDPLDGADYEILGAYGEALAYQEAGIADAADRFADQVHTDAVEMDGSISAIIANSQARGVKVFGELVRAGAWRSDHD